MRQLESARKLEKALSFSRPAANCAFIGESTPNKECTFIFSAFPKLHVYGRVRVYHFIFTRTADFAEPLSASWASEFV